MSKKVIVIFLGVLIGNFCFLIFSWKKLINSTHYLNHFHIKFYIYFPCTIMSIVIYYPQRLLINITSIIIYYIFFRRFDFYYLIYDLDRIFEETFNFGIRNIF